MPKTLPKTICLVTSGMGIVLHSPWATANLTQGEDFLTSRFSNPTDVAELVNSSRIAAFCTGSPGAWRLHLRTGPPDETALVQADYKVRLGVEVRDGILQIRDLFELMSWDAACDDEQVIQLTDGFYRITAYTSPPESGILGDDQDIHLHLEAVSEPARLVHHGVPQLCD
jgi:hypothetical protein